MPCGAACGLARDSLAATTLRAISAGYPTSWRALLDAITGMEHKSWMCLICGWIYDEEAGLPEEGIAPGTRWEDVPVNWTCPECGARKEDFEMVQI